MSSNARAKAEEFRTVIQSKIAGIVTEFAEGKLSREQFHQIYARYNAQLNIANQALSSGNPDAYAIAQDGLSTIAIREELEGKAMGLMIYHNHSGTVLETLGDFTVSVNQIAPVLNDFSRLMDEEKYIDRRVEQLDTKQWLHYAAGRYTTVITEFRNEPSQRQNAEIERLHHDFEHANRPLLQKDTIDPNRLAYPFIVFIQKKFKG